MSTPSCRTLLTKLLVLMCCVITATEGASAQRSRRPGGQRSRQSRPARLVGYVRIASVTLLEEVGYFRKLKENLLFGEKVYYTEKDLADAGTYLWITAESGKQGYVNIMALTFTPEELNAIKLAGVIPQSLLRAENRFLPPPFVSTFSVTDETNFFGTGKKVAAGDALYLTSDANMKKALCDRVDWRNPHADIIGALCNEHKTYDGGVVYLYDGKVFREWDYSEDRSGQKLSGTWERTYGANEGDQQVLNISQNSGNWIISFQENVGSKTSVDFVGQAIRFAKGTLHFRLALSQPSINLDNFDIQDRYRFRWKLATEFNATARIAGDILTVRYDDGRMVFSKRRPAASSSRP